MKSCMFETPWFEAGTELAICDSSCVRRAHEIKMHPATVAVLMRFRPYCSTVVISRRVGYGRYSFLCCVRNASPSGGGVARPLFSQPWRSKQEIPSSLRMTFPSNTFCTLVCADWAWKGKISLESAQARHCQLGCRSGPEESPGLLAHCSV